MTKNEHIGHINACQICAYGLLDTVLSLGHHAPVHAHLTAAQLHEKEEVYPLNLCRCSNCGLLQLDYIVDPKTLFYPNYPYFTGMTNMLIREFRQLRDTLIAKYNVAKDDLVIDIGSNDGTLLDGFKERGMRVLGVEPTNVADVANQKGISTIKEFFGEETTQKILTSYGKAKVVTATNMFAHVNNIFELTRGISSILADDGVFVSESQYLMDMLEKTALDTIYHEHLRYYSLRPLQKMLSLAGMSMVDAERVEAAGGSIRVYAIKGDRHPSEQLKRLIETEDSAGIYDDGAFNKLSEPVKQAKLNLLELLIACKKENKRVVGIGAPGRSNTLLNYMHIDNQILDYAVEKGGSPKIGLFTPGTHIPIVDEKILFSDQPDYGLLLSWHIADELTAKLRSLGYRGKFIVPLPEPKILEI